MLGPVRLQMASSTAADSRSLNLDDSEEEAKTDYSSSSDSDASELGFDDAIEEAREGQKFEDDSKVSWKDYKYCISRDDNEIPTETVMRET